VIIFEGAKNRKCIFLPGFHFENMLIIFGHIINGVIKGAFTLGRFRARFRTKLARLVMKKKYFFSKLCKLNAKSRVKIANVNAPKPAI